MDISFLEEHFDELMENMRFQSYSEREIAECVKVYRNFILFAKYDEWKTFEDAWAAYTEKNSSLSESILKSRHSALKKVIRYAMYSEFPVHQLSQNQLKLEIHSKGKLDLYNLQCKIDIFLSLLESEGYRVGKDSTLRTSIGVLSQIN